MKITINDRRKIYAVQKAFTKAFPYLKIEFFAKPSKIGGASSERPVKNEARTLGECRTIHDTGTISISPGMTVSDLQQNFRDVFGLSVQIYRKSGKIWLPTSATDTWTLEEQNLQGEALSNTFS